MVYEIDDDLLDVDPSNTQAWNFFTKPEIRANVIRNIKVADLVTTSTAPLAEVVSKYNKNVAVLPNCIPAALLEAPPAPGRKGVVIGWSGGASHRLDLAELGSNLSRFVHRHPDVSLHAIGDAEASAQLAKGVTDRAKFTPWIESVPGFHAAIDFDITLAPLRASTFNRSKSAIRCLEAAALGIPVVASDFGPYADFVRHGETGLLARWPHQWMSHLKQLLDPAARQEMGANARKLAERHTIEGSIELWEKAYQL
jgi:glycosyltransferase involved in cell wall biosynthesis